MASTARVAPLANQTKLTTLQTHMLADAERFPDAGGVLAWIVSALAISVKTIAARLRRARLEDVLGAAGECNIQGEAQQKLDVIANDVLIQILRGRNGVAVIGSEEDDELLLVEPAGGHASQFAVYFDPLDGSSNLDIAGNVGTIFSIYRTETTSTGRLSPGREQVAAGYVLYGPSTIFVLTTGAGVHMFVLDPAIGAFISVGERVKIPEFGATYSVNDANIESFPRGYRRYLHQCREEGFSARYAGAMVADVHRILINGGIFMYPPTAQLPDGKLRLMYEANPMAMIIEQAGGLSSTGAQRILDVSPENLHERVPVILGSPENVNELLDCVHGR